MTNQVRDVQILYSDQIGALYQSCRLLMQPGIARVRDLAVQSLDLRTHLPAAVAAALAARQRALTAAQFFFCALRDARVRDHHVVAAIGEHLEAEIDAHRRLNRTFLGNLCGDGQANMPAATIATEHTRANVRLIWQRAVQMHFEAARHAREAQSLAVEPNAAELGEAERIPSTLSSESWESSLLASSFQTTKESLKRIVHPL